MDNPKQPFDEADVLLRFTLPAMPERERKMKNIALEYVVVREPDSPCEIMTYGRFSDSIWRDTLHDDPIIAHLLRELAAAKKENERLSGLLGVIARASLRLLDATERGSDTVMVSKSEARLIEQYLAP
jgi:hypothetical protein